MMESVLNTRTAEKWRLWTSCERCGPGAAGNWGGQPAAAVQVEHLVTPACLWHTPAQSGSEAGP